MTDLEYVDSLIPKMGYSRKVRTAFRKRYSENQIPPIRRQQLKKWAKRKLDKIQKSVQEEKASGDQKDKTVFSWWWIAGTAVIVTVIYLTR